MKALTVTEPWATLIAIGAKRIETRSWPTEYRGPVAIHSRARGPIPEGLHLDHLCRNRNCVNPDHLDPVTNSENSHRGNRSKLNWESVAEIRALAGTMTNAEIGRKLGISRPTVSEVVHRKTWVDEPGS